MAQWVRLPFMYWSMVRAIQLLVPQQRIGVSLVLLDETNRVFLLNHVFHPHQPWGLPGGWLKRNEDPAIGVLRELREETGLTAVLGPVVHVSHQNNPHHMYIAYLGQLQTGAMQLSGEIISADWFHLESLPKALYPFMREAIHAASHLKPMWQTASYPLPTDKEAHA